jgi:carboxymethylenebutenolidase
MNQIARRSLLTGLVATPLAVILADPILRAAAAEGLETVSVTTADGRTEKAALAVPAKTPAPAVLLIHEWWGLNEQMKTMAAELAKEGFLALAVDLYEGKVASDATAANTYMQALEPNKATQTLVAWINWLKQDKRSTGKVATIGWCFGGGWSLNASIAAPVDATVIYYGQVTRPAADLAKLKGPVLGQFAEKDQWINHDMVAGFEAEMKKANKPLTTYSYPADHAFANPTGQNYDKEDAQLAWTRTLAFLRANLS